MQSNIKLSGFVRQTLALTALLSAGAVLAGAQTAAPKSLNLQLPTVQTTAAEPEFSSSATPDAAPDGTVETASLVPHVDFLNAMQYGGRQRSGRPRYRGGNRTQDGVEKYTFFAGAGFTAPVGDQSNYLKPSYGFQVGIGRNFTRHATLNAQFDWDNFGFTGQTLNNYSGVFTGDYSNGFGIDGGSHIWSFTLNPQYNFHQGEGLGAYVVVGGGFYHKEATFFITQVYEECYFYCEDYAANATIQNYSSNSAGVNGGLGLTYKFSRFANEKFYAEVRVVHTFNNYRPGIDENSSLAQQASYTGWNYFPRNSQETTYFPVKFGIRF